MSLDLTTVVAIAIVAIAASLVVHYRSSLSSVATVSLSVALLAGLGLSSSLSATAATPFKITNTVSTAKDGAIVMVKTSGGSGNGAVIFTVGGTVCKINAKTGALTSPVNATCFVTAIKHQSRLVPEAKATHRFVFFTASQAALTISNKKLTGEVGIPITVTAKGGTGTGAVTFATTGATCSINAESGALNAFAVGTCPVTATKAGSGMYPAITSPAVTFTFTAGPQAALLIGNSPLTGTIGTPVALFTSGGSGNGAVTYTVTGTGCSLNGASLSDTSAGACTVIATKAASASFLSATSAPAVFTFSAATGGGGNTGENPTYATPDVATLTSVTGQTGSQIDDTVNGDSYFINAYYFPSDHWYMNYLNEGATVTLNWHVNGSDGKKLVGANVTLYSNLDYSSGCGVTWDASNAGLNSCSNGGGSGQGSITGTTDEDGNVSFTLVNTNTNAISGVRSSKTPATAAAEADEATFHYCDMLLEVNTDVYTSGTPNPSINLATDRVDFILGPMLT